MTKHSPSISPSELFASLWRHRNLTGVLIKREVIGRYRGSMLGILWSFFHPILMLAVYTFVFSVVFNARWTGGTESKTEFALVLFAGLIVFNLFAECVNRSPTLIVANPSFVKKVVFPLEILPWVSLGSALFHMLVSLLVWLAFYVIFLGTPKPTVLIFPFLLIPLILMTMGFSWLLASLGVFVRDVTQVIGILTTTLMFISPIFYPVSALPAEYAPILTLSPLTVALEQIRGALIWGYWPDIEVLSTYLAISFLVAWGGFAWFQKTRKGFADVL